LDAYGFTKHPPWSPFAQLLLSLTTPAPFEAESRDEKSGVLTQKRLCFGLHHTNCGQTRTAPKPKVTKACLFGLRCKESSFVDRFAVKTLPTTTTTTTVPPDIETTVDAVDASTGKKKKKTGEGLMTFEEKVKDNYTEADPAGSDNKTKKKKKKAHTEESKVEPPPVSSLDDIIPAIIPATPTNESQIPIINTTTTLNHLTSSIPNSLLAFEDPIDQAYLTRSSKCCSRVADGGWKDGRMDR